MTECLTAVQTEAGNLKLISWQFDGRDIHRLGDVSAGAVDRICSVRIFKSSNYGTDRVATVTRSSESGKLKIIVWEVTVGGELVRQSEISAGRVRQVSVCTIDNHERDEQRIATALETDSGDLKVVIWEISNRGDVTRKGDAAAGAAQLVSICRIPSAERNALAATAVQTSEGNLEIITWEIDNSGNVARRDSVTAGEISGVCVTPLNYPQERYHPERLIYGNIATAIRDAEGNFKVIAWHVNERGEITRRGSSSAGAIGAAISACSAVEGEYTMPPEHHDKAELVTAVQDDSGRLKMIVWYVSTDGEFTRITDQVDVSADSLSLSHGVSDTGYYLTGLIDEHQNLNVSAWRANRQKILTKLATATAGHSGLVSIVGVGAWEAWE